MGSPVDGAGHAFISYVREDADRVARIVRILQAAGIPVWTDKQELSPGEDWRLRIREAIKRNSLAFVAIFSSQSAARSSSYQNEELLLAIDVFRQYAPDRPWLIPVRLDDCELPSFELGAGRTLDSLQRVDLFGQDADTEAIRLVTAILRILGEQHLNSATTAAAVLMADDDRRGQVLARAVKEMLLDPQRQIELEELIVEEVARERRSLLSQEQFPTDSPRLVNGVGGIRFLAEQYESYWRTIAPLAAALATGCTWGTPSHASLWSSAMRTIGSTALAEQSGKTVLIELRNYPTIALMYAGALGAVSRKNWVSLKAISTDPEIREHGRRTPLIGKAHPGVLLQGFPQVASVIAMQDDGQAMDDAQIEALLNGRQGARYTPISDHLHARLRPLFADAILDDDDYSEAFDDMEILLGVLAEDAAIQAREQNMYLHGAWFGRFTWRDRHGEPTDQRMFQELEANGQNWGPLQAGLFGGSVDRAKAAFARFVEDAAKVRNHRW